MSHLTVQLPTSAPASPDPRRGPVAPRPRSGTDTPADARTRILFVRLADLPDGHPDRRRIRERIIELYLPLAAGLARRFRNSAEPHDDLYQVAAISLIRAVDGFDPGRGVEFASYAVPSIVGELKRHFRDRSWSVRVPRRLQELKSQVARATEELSQTLQRTPTVTDLADHLGVSEEDVRGGLDMANPYRAMSLHTPAARQDAGQDAGAEVVDLLGDADPGMARVEDRATLRPLIDKLPERERRIIVMRFFGNLTQSQIAKRIGLSQMHVSRLLAQSLEQLREGMLATD